MLINTNLNESKLKILINPHFDQSHIDQDLNLYLILIHPTLNQFKS